MKPLPKNKEGTEEPIFKRTFSFLKEIKLDSISVDKKILHNNLNEKLWKDFNLDSKVREDLLEISQEFYDFLGIKSKVKDVFFTGSLANFNYSKYSDIDVHLVIDFSEVADEVELVQEFFFTKSSLWELKHDIKVKGFPVQMFAQDTTKESRKSSGICSLTKNKWIQKPSFEDFEIDTESLKHKIKRIVDKIELLDKYKLSPEKLYSHSKKVKDEINRMRQSGLDKEGEYSLENLAFKWLRNNKYIERLKDLIEKSFDKIYSLK